MNNEERTSSGHQSDDSSPQPRSLHRDTGNVYSTSIGNTYSTDYNSDGYRGGVYNRTPQGNFASRTNYGNYGSYGNSNYGNYGNREYGNRGNYGGGNYGNYGNREYGNRGNYGDRESYNRQGGYQNRQGGYQNRQGGYQNRQGG
ncbi:MAG: hypothetical protein RML40_12390, partial [Bacteroidota bacterium]|nr:hypothetical protein [Candidatus Kapabacteria bacterium]MDW8221314.1 hypothetical protein [Bacteroidota bacterium]